MSVSKQRRHRGWVLAPLAAGILWAACGAAEETAAPTPTAALERTTVVVAGEAFDVEVAADPASRRKGLSGRQSIPRNGGMLFVHPRSERSAMVMRDCPNPIDVAFIDSMGRVVAIHAMVPEPPRTRSETPFAYERRLKGYPSGQPAQFALETAGGRLAELGLAVGDRVHFEARALVARAR